MEVLQAVLDTQFWLATHVTTITLGYSTTFVAGLVGFALGTSDDIVGLLAVIALVAGGQALALELDGGGSVSVSAVGALAGASLFGPKAALPLAIAITAVAWSSQRTGSSPFRGGNSTTREATRIG